MAKLMVFKILLISILIIISQNLILNFPNNPSTISASILFVGGSGPGNYSKIQDAIDSANSGDIIRVFNGNYNENLIINNSGITLIGNGSEASNIIAGMNIGIQINANLVNITGFSISTSNSPSSHGIFLNNSKNSTINNISISTSAQDSFGILVVNSTALILNSSILTSDQSLDINITKFGCLEVINSQFNNSKVNVEYDSGGVLWIKNHLDILIYYNDGKTPIQNADVNITDNNIPIYLTPGYNGNMPQTNANGMIEDVIICDGWFNFNNTPIENITNISVKKKLDRYWEDFRNYIDMNASHIETFISSDITAPPTPTGLMIARIPGMNSLNISWDLNPDTVTYEVWAIKACYWVIIDNVTHPKNWTLDENLLDNMDHYYQVRAWDSVGLKSDYAFKSFNLSDITPPKVPNNLSVKPVLGGDAINISWDISLDDTVNYELWWKEPNTKNWTMLINVSQPNHYVICSSDLLINSSLYRFKIRAWDKVGYNSSFTSIRSVIHRDYSAPDPPTKLAANAISDTMINLSWTPSPDHDVEGYLVYINKPGTTSGGPYKKIDIVNSTSYSFTNLAENINYYFVVKALDEANNTSPFSFEVSNKTLAIKPEIPAIDEIPKYVNKTIFPVTGTSEMGAKIFVVVNGKDTFSGITNKTGRFKVEITMKEGKNWIIARARDIAFVYSEYTEQINITVDTEPPVARAGGDIQIQKGEYALLNASGSNDNLGILRYQWKFNYAGKDTALSGEINTFKFDLAGNYLITLILTDLAGNQANDIIWINVSEIILPKPKVENTYPLPGTTGFPIKDKVIIYFSISMDVKSVEKVLEIQPEIVFETKWTNSDKVLSLDFKGKLKYNTSFTLTIGKAKAVNGEILLNDTYVFNFTTEKEPIISKIIIIYPQPGMQFKSGEIITVSGSSLNLKAESELEISISSKVFKGKINSEGNWSVEIRLPTQDGEYELRVSCVDTNASVLIKIKSAEDGKEDGSKDKGILGLGLMIDVIVLAIIILIILTTIFYLLRKKQEEEFDKEFEEEEE